MHTQVIERLQAARNWITDQDHWTTGVRWDGDKNCALGAVERAYGGDRMVNSTTPEVRLLGRAALEICPSICEFSSALPDVPTVQVAVLNNHYGHATTLQMFDRAIEMAFERLVKETQTEEKETVHA